MRWEDFDRWFNNDFWKAFKKRAFPILIPRTPTEKKQRVRAVFESVKSGRYAPSIPEAEIVMNKGHGVARTVPVFCIDDYIVYYFCITELEDVISGNRTNHTFGGWTLGGKLRNLENIDVQSDNGYSNVRYAFNPRAWASAFGEFNSLLFAQLDTGAYTHILQFDLSNFYDSVRLDILERWIREDASAEKGWVIALLFYFLNQRNRRNTGLHPQGVGLPQDALADCSRLLANYYLQKYDKFAAASRTNRNASYFRYADDQMILINGTEGIEALMLLLTRNLDRYGLRVNQKKVEMWTIRQLQNHRCRPIQSIFSNKDDNQSPQLVRQFVDAYLKLSTKKLESSWNAGLPLLNRLLWANIESLPKRLFNTLLARFFAPEYLLRADKDKLLRLEKLNCKRKKPIILTRRLIELGEKTVHNAFHYEVLAFASEIRDKELETFFEKRLSEIKLEMDADRIFP
jgi:hypothetical protein